MSATTVQTRTPRATLVALLVLTLCFVLVVYTLTHEAGHAIVGMLFGQTLTALKVNFLTLSAHVGLVGELTQAQHAVQSIAGAALPLAVWLIFISCVPRRTTLIVEMLKCIASVAVLSTLLAWMVLPVLYRLGPAPSDDVSNFLSYSRMEPGLLSLLALVIYIVGWLWFFTRIQGMRSEMALFSTADGNVVHAGLRLPLALMTGILIACSSLIVVLGNALNPLAPPQDFQPIAQLDLATRARTAETLWQFALDQPAEIGIYAVVQGINTTYFDLRLTGSAGFDAVILHGEDYTTDQDRVTWSRELPPGQYRLVATACQTPGTISIYGKDK
jgi:hypothetical protein